MKTNQSLTQWLLRLSLTALLFNSQILWAQSQVALVIPDTFYTHNTLLNHVYFQKWLAKGPALEQAIKQQTNFPQQMTWCGETNEANVILSLEPNLFYNPQTRLYYAQIIAKGYQNNTSKYAALQPFTSVSIETTFFGDLLNNADYFIEKAFQQTANKLFSTLQQDTAYLNAIDGKSIDDTAGLCNALKQAQRNTFYY